MNKNKILLFTSFAIVSVALINAIFLQESEALYSIPPTTAFNNITDGVTIINANNYTDRLFLTAGSNMTLQYFPANNTIRFSAAGSSGGGGGGEVFTWTATHNADGNILDNILKVNDGGTHFNENGIINLANNEAISWTNSGNTSVATLTLGAGGQLTIRGSDQTFFITDSGNQVSAKWQREDAAFTGVLGNFAFRANSDTPALKDFAKILVDVEDNANGAEQSAFRFQVRDGTGALPTVLAINDGCASACGRIDTFMPVTLQAGDRISFRGTTDRTEGIQSDLNNQLNFYTNNGHRMLIANVAVRTQAGVSFSVPQGQVISLDGGGSQESIRSDGTSLIFKAINIDTASIDSTGITLVTGKYLYQPPFTDANRPSCGATTNGLIIFNDDDGLLNVCDNPNWEFVNGTTT